MNIPNLEEILNKEVRGKAVPLIEFLEWMRSEGLVVVDGNLYSQRPMTLVFKYLEVDPGDLSESIAKEILKGEEDED